MLLIRHPATYPAERHYIFHVMLGEFLGQTYRTEVHAGADIVISSGHDDTGVHVVMPDILFQTPAEHWLLPSSLPKEPLAQLKTVRIGQGGPDLPPTIPVIYGRALADGGYVSSGQQGITLGLDLFGSAFFMLSRYEEVVAPVLDRHDRYPATASLAWRQGFLHRPVVNEYVELLWACLHRINPSLQRPERNGRILLSHDVDWPAVTWGRSMPQVLRAATGDILKRREPLLAARRLHSYRQVLGGNLAKDVGNVHDSFMDLSERHGLRSTFYFIAGHGSGDIDGAYTIDHPWIRGLLRQIHERGHAIGIHPGYYTFRDSELTCAQVDRLRHVCEAEGITQQHWGGRQHFLRWENPTTWQNYESAGLDYDTTLSFADHVGFRCGVCYEFPVFNLRTRNQLRLRERPLMVMDATLFGERAAGGMALEPRGAIETIARLHATCKQYEGDFAMLWHNTWLIQSSLRAAYCTALQEVTT